LPLLAELINLDTADHDALRVRDLQPSGPPIGVILKKDKTT